MVALSMRLRLSPQARARGHALPDKPRTDRRGLGITWEQLREYDDGEDDDRSRWEMKRGPPSAPIAMDDAVTRRRKAAMIDAICQTNPAQAAFRDAGGGIASWRGDCWSCARPVR
jgi:hypothetical protein